MAKLFSPFRLKNLELKNRVVMSPMCQYAAEADGCANNWHLVHYGSRAVGGAGMICVEASAVEARGRISERDLGLYDDRHVEGLERIVQFSHANGAKVGIQLAHAGRKADLQGERIVAPSAIRFSDHYQQPAALTLDEIGEVVRAFGRAAQRAVAAGMDMLEIHAAHGYLIHQFLSPYSNHRTDPYGGSFENRVRFAVDVIREVRRNMPEGMPLFIRVSAVEYVENGYSFEEMIEMCRVFQREGVDLIDVSSGGNVPVAPHVYPGYQVKYAEGIRNALRIPVMAVGLLEEPKLAESVLQDERADLIAIGRGMLRNPLWTKHAAMELGADLELPGVYRRAFS
jgi:NADPH2 dehydrogenase